jgi:hypothetical protein
MVLLHCPYRANAGRELPRVNPGLSFLGHFGPKMGNVQTRWVCSLDMMASNRSLGSPENQCSLVFQLCSVRTIERRFQRPSTGIYPLVNDALSIPKRIIVRTVCRDTNRLTFKGDLASKAANVSSGKVGSMQIILYERLYKQQKYGRPDR